MAVFNYINKNSVHHIHYISRLSLFATPIHKGHSFQYFTSQTQSKLRKIKPLLEKSQKTPFTIWGYKDK